MRIARTPQRLEHSPCRACNHLIIARRLPSGPCRCPGPPACARKLAMPIMKPMPRAAAPTPLMGRLAGAPRLLVHRSAVRAGRIRAGDIAATLSRRRRSPAASATARSSQRCGIRAGDLRVDQQALPGLTASTPIAPLSAAPSALPASAAQAPQATGATSVRGHAPCRHQRIPHRRVR